MQSGPPVTIAILVAVLFLGLPLAGLVWLIFKRCKFSIGQLFFSIFVYGVWLSLVHQSRQMEIEKRISLSIAGAIAVLLCMFVGARAAAKIEPRNHRRRRLFYLAGFFVLPSAIMGAILFCVMMAHGNPMSADYWAIAIPVWIVAVPSIWTTTNCLTMKTFDSKD